MIVLLFGNWMKAHGQTDVRLFQFVNSTVEYSFPINPVPSDETKVAHWIYLLAQETGESFAAGGQFGFLPQHADLPPISQFGYDLVPGVWESDYDPFSVADINTVMITSANFIQNESPGTPYFLDPDLSPLSATRIILDWVEAEEPGVKYYLYQNWPDMAGFLGAGFPPNSTEFSNYNNYTSSIFHDWWLEYQDSLLLTHPDLNVRLIPVGHVLEQLITSPLLSGIPVTEFYEDDAPHGRASLYFLAGVISYCSIYEMPAPSTFVVPSTVHPLIVANYNAIIAEIWAALQTYNLSDGASRVFCGTTTDVPEVVRPVYQIEYVNPDFGLRLIGDLEGKQISVFDLNGREQMSLQQIPESGQISLNGLPTGYLILKVYDERGALWSTPIIIR